jgi:dTDP-4-dehydrorhamnose reductase
VLKIAIFGSTGFLGSYFVENIKSRCELYVYKRKIIHDNQNENPRVIYYELNKSSILETLSTTSPDIIINTAGIISIEKCSQDPELAFLANSSLPKWIAEYSASNPTKLLHFSTDAVFGQQGGYFDESEEPKPVSVYGKSKHAGEINILELDSKALILRTNFFGLSKNKESLFNYFYYRSKLNSSSFGYTNVFFTPIYVRQVVDISLSILNKNLSGIFHLVGNDKITKFDFGKKIYEFSGGNMNQLIPIAMINHSSDRFRSLDLSLDNSKIRRLGFVIQNYTSGIIDSIKLVERE